MQAKQAPKISRVRPQKEPMTESRLLRVQMRKVKFPSTFHTIRSWSCMRRCRKSGNTQSHLRKPSLHIQYRAIGGSTSHIAGTATLFTRDIRLDASVVSTRYFGVHNVNKKPGAGICGCVMLDMYQEKKAVLSSSGPSSMMMAILCGPISDRRKRLPQPWPISQLLNSPIVS